jgi:hypothetical protein
MSRIVDNLIAYRILKMLVTNFEDTEAFKLGIIDKHGKNLRKTSLLQTTREREAYTYLNRLVFNVKKLINRLPGGENKLKSLIAALWLVKEQYQSGSRSTAMLQEKFDKQKEDHEVIVRYLEDQINQLKSYDPNSSQNSTKNIEKRRRSTSSTKIFKRTTKNQ